MNRFIDENQGLRVNMREQEANNLEMNYSMERLKDELEDVHRMREKCLQDNSTLLHKIDMMNTH